MIPQAVIDALNALNTSSADLASKKNEKAAKDQAAAEATHAAELAATAVDTSKAKLTSDKQSLLDLINATFPTE